MNLSVTKLTDEDLRKELALLTEAIPTSISTYPPNAGDSQITRDESDVCNEHKNTVTNLKESSPDYIDKDAQSIEQVSERVPFNSPRGIDAEGKEVYAGDSYDNSKPLREGKFERLDFAEPAEMLALYDKYINEGVVLLYEWQKDISHRIGYAKCNQMVPFKAAVCACNGSGKDAFVIAPFAIWFAISKIQSRCIITSSSGTQLTSQTETYIRNLAQSINEYHGEQIFKINQRFIKCRLTGSEIRLFATDEEGKAEGYHPIVPNAEMAIVVNEAKNVAPEIYRALRRCTGYNYWLDVSSPGAPLGDFYDHFTKWPHKFHIDYTKCPRHASEVERLEDLEKDGEHNWYYRSKWLALFTSVDTNAIIPMETVERVRALSKQKAIPIMFTNWPLRIGLDLAAGGDETVLTVTKGNKIQKRIAFREKDTTIAAARLDLELAKLEIKKDHEHIYGDDGGVGRGILDMLVDKGWSISRVNNQSPPSDKKRYINRGAENWYRVARIINGNVFILDLQDDDNDKRFYSQLGNRYQKQQATQGRIALESKQDAKANGRPSPDRADSFILSLTGLTLDDFLDKKDDSVRANKAIAAPKNIDETIQWGEDKMYSDYEDRMNGGKGEDYKIQVGHKKSFGSINTIVKRMTRVSAPSKWSGY